MSKKCLHHPQGELAVEKDGFKDVCKRDLKAMKIGPDNNWEDLAILYPESSGFSASNWSPGETLGLSWRPTANQRA